MARIQVKLRDGRVGSIDEQEFNPQSMMRLDAPQQQPVQQQPAPQKTGSLSETVGNGAMGLLASTLNPVIDLVNLGLQNVGGNAETAKKTKGNLWESVLQAGRNTDKTFVSPEAGKVAAETASFAVPFGKGANLLTKYLAPGAAVGGLSSASQGDNAAEIAGNTLLGGAGAGVFGKALPWLVKAGGKMATRGGDYLEGQASKQVLQASPGVAAKAVEEHGLDVNSTFNKYFKGKTDYDEILGKVDERNSGGLWGSKMSNAEKTIQDEVDNAGSTIRFSSDELTGALQKEKGLLKKTVGNDDRIAELDRLIKDVGSRYRNGVSARQLLNLKRAADSKYAKSVTNTDKGSVISVTQKVLGNASRNLLKSRFSNIKGALDQEAELLTLQPILSAGRGKEITTGKGPFSLADILTGVGVGATTGNPAIGAAAYGVKKLAENPKVLSKAASGLNKIGSVKNLTGNATIDNLLGQAGARSTSLLDRGNQPFNNEHGGEQQNPTDGSPINIHMADTIPQPGADVNTMGLNDDKQARLAKAQEYISMKMMEDLSTTGGKNISKLQAISAVLEKMKEKDGSNKPLPVAAQNQVNLAKSGSRGLAEAWKIYDDDPDVLAKQLVPGQWVSRQFDSAMFRTVEALLRARSGAAVPEQEVRRYLDKYGPRYGDSAEVVKFKFGQLQQDFSDVLEGAGNTAGSVQDPYQQSPLQTY